ncbi:CRP-like cAMP-binding protein [Maritimibacter alkaliphilus HTCC2654]|uniref:Transcriptional regulator, Fnr-type n=1 Tax=Maritimibacter alkaliphilus HTCC2654 TaxID=314271 RepID=A3VK21_9RHOB|nr:Crp/Fnr family transcriptional regulator [Maritimibacter alkaliphilus]EAQ11326.1 transcriptional regulator, Fnr-type [Rhodobacterales bacterium HTCC2654] [Maritimibacter alkaliphilus HTCC2654]TYP80125.1 CRP-like cAMP-binding protein [Maritimibacter alkaliphilus HTCC2654]
MTERDYPLTRRFLQGRSREALSEREKGILEDLVEDVERFTAPHVILERGDVVNRSTILIEGMIARIIAQDGKRHIVALHVPGDFVDLHAFALKRLDHDVVSIGTVQVGYVTHQSLNRVLETEPNLSRILWYSTLLDAAMHREWILKLELLDADGRLAHLCAELWHRLDFVGMAGENGFALPLTQKELSDACGTTSIHMNRVVRKLRESGIVDISRGQVTILDRAALERVGRFDASYLYGDGPLKLT